MSLESRESEDVLSPPEIFNYSLLFNLIAADAGSRRGISLYRSWSTLFSTMSPSFLSSKFIGKIIEGSIRIRCWKG